MSDELRTVLREIDAYIGAVGDPGVRALGSIPVPIPMLKRLRLALRAEEGTGNE